MTAQPAAEVLRNPRLRSILEGVTDDAHLRNLFLTDQDRANLMAAFRLRHKNFPLFQGTYEDLEKGEYQEMCKGAQAQFDELMQTDESLRSRVLKNCSSHYQPMVRVYQVPETHGKGSKIRNILYLNRAPDCYSYHSGIEQLLIALSEQCYHKSLVFSATAVDTIPLFLTKEIHAIFNCDAGSRSGPRPDMDAVVMAIRVASGDQKDSLEMRALYDHIRMVPMNSEHGNMNEFLGILSMVTPFQKAIGSLW